eukprot:c13567_g1_i1 orf=220-2058(-)
MEQVEQQVSNPAMVPSSSRQSSLYVGDLDYSVTEPEVFEFFCRVGQVVSVRVIHNESAKASYAYVNYTCPEDAHEAINVLNFSHLRGKPMRIMYMNPDPTLRKSGAANIFIKNLDPLVDSKILHDNFSVYGTILSCRVATNAAGVSKGFGFVQFEQEEAAVNAINKANGMVIHERQIFVGPFLKKEERDSATAAAKFNNLYVKNFTDTTSDEDLHRIFGAFGPITSAVVMRDMNGNSKCFGFVNFENADDAAKAVENLNGEKIDDKEWYVGRAQKKSEREAELREKFDHSERDRLERQKDVNLYVKNIDANVDEKMLKELFSLHGHVISSKIIRSPEGQSKGVGFVTYSSPEEARKAINEMNGTMFGSKALYVAKAQRKEDRQGRDGMVNGPRINPSSMFHPGPAILGQQFFYGHPGLMPPQSNGFGYQHPLMPGMVPGAVHMPNYFMPPPQRPGFQGPRMGKRGIGGPMQPPLLQQQTVRSSSNRPMRYSQSARNPSNMENIEAGETSAGMSAPENALSSLPASVTPEQHRSMLGEQLYPLVHHLEHERAGKVTGMLLELDETEIVHLIKSPEALRAKVTEAMEVLRLAQGGTTLSSVDIASLSINEAVDS